MLPRKALPLPLLVLLLAACRRDEGSDLLERYQAALERSRQGPGRLVGAPCLKITVRGRPAEGESSVARPVRGPGAELRVATGEGKSEAERMEGVIAFQEGRWKDAVVWLERSAARAPRSAPTWNDLAAVHLALWNQARDSYELVLAFSAATKALAVDPSLQSARFNRALALDGLTLWPQLKEEWRELSARERDDGWTREIQRRADATRSFGPPPDQSQLLAKLTQLSDRGDDTGFRRAVEKSRRQVRELVENQLLADWAKAGGGMAPPEDRGWRLARRAARELASLSGDGTASDTMSQIEKAREAKTSEWVDLREGLAAFYRGRDLAREEKDLEGALQELLSAQKRLERWHCPAADWVTYQIAVRRFYRGENDLARSELARITSLKKGTRPSAARGRAFSLTGLLDSTGGHLASAADNYGRAVEQFERISEGALAAQASSALTEHLDTLGRSAESWRHLYPFLSSPSSSSDPEVRRHLCIQAYWIAYRQGELELALRFHEEMSRLPAGPNPLARASAFRSRATLLAGLGRTSEAAQALADARSVTARPTDPKERASLEGDLDFLAGQLASASRPEEAIPFFDAAIASFRSSGYALPMARALLERSRAERASGQNAKAGRDLTAAVRELERQRSDLRDGEDRIGFLDRRREIYDAMVDFQLEVIGDPEAALSYSEQGKARVLWDWLKAAPSPAPSPQLLAANAEALPAPAVLQAALPRGATFLSYHVLPDRVLIWVLRRDQPIEVRVSAVKAADLGLLVESFSLALQDDRPKEAARLGEALYDRIVRPVASFLAPEDRLVVVPDGALHLLPFAALRNRDTNTFLAQEHVIENAPSLRVFAEARRRDRQRERSPAPSELITSAPAFDRQIDPSLGELKAWAIEEEFARFFPGSRARKGPDATREAFLEGGAEFEILYFGGHSLVNARNPMLSSLLFAAAPGDPRRGVLLASEILQNPFPKTRLVILASCKTGVGKVSSSEGVENLARPFLAAGVPSVVASLWSVDDRATAGFFRRFHWHLSHRFDPAAALRATQVEFLTSRDGTRRRTSVWAGFEAIGGLGGDEGGAGPNGSTNQARGRR